MNSKISEVLSKTIKWSQDLKSLNIKITITRVSLKKIDIFMSDLVVKINVQENNFLKIFDLFAEIDYQNKENMITYENDTLDLYIIKHQQKFWDNLTTQKLNKEELRKRREDSYRRKEEIDKKFNVDRDDLKISIELLKLRLLIF